MNWYIGQEIVAIETHPKGWFKKDGVYRIRGLRDSLCNCHTVCIDIGTIYNLEYGSVILCYNCHSRWVANSGVFWHCESSFAPLEYDKQAIEELLKIEQPLKS